VFSSLLTRVTSPHLAGTLPEPEISKDRERDDHDADDIEHVAHGLPPFLLLHSSRVRVVCPLDVGPIFTRGPFRPTGMALKSNSPPNFPGLQSSPCIDEASFTRAGYIPVPVAQDPCPKECNHV
jgi:hypothetical protein